MVSFHLVSQTGSDHIKRVRTYHCCHPCHRTDHVDVSRDAQLLTKDLLVFVKGHELDSSVGKYPDHHGPIAFIKPQVTLLPWHDTESSYHTSRREGGERA